MIRKRESKIFERKLLTTSNQAWTSIHGLLAHVNRATESQRPNLRVDGIVMKSRCTKVSPREKQKHDLPAILEGNCHTRRTQSPSSFLFFPDSLFLLSQTNPIPPNQPPMVFRTDCLYSPSPCILVTNPHAITTVEVIVRRNRRNSTLLTNIFLFSFLTFFTLTHLRLL